ncbi:TRAP transporter small permease [Solibacillus sp. A46]|uniref:TRAP transporter small permease n=1 Tax=Solibacillus faecavium TaxID=2762221 RepID=A0ABR8Y074_9BACL|nr:TRAP transporter small permease [Solibacillus faecavium]MBD8037603.1 TRAP transporter small permease [Solibacillus faecavium]
MTKLSNIVTKVEEVIMGVLMAILTVIMVTAVFFRYVLSDPLPWATEVSIYLFIWFSFIGGSWGLKYGTQAAVTFLLDALSENKQRILKIVQDVIMLAFLIIIFVYSVKWLMLPSTMLQKSTSLGMPMWLPYSAVPIGILFATIHIVARLIRLFKNEEKSQQEEIGDELV